MSPRPKKLSKAPRALDLEDRRGDVLADVLGVALLRNVVYKRLEAHAPWGIAAPAHPRAVFYVIARGNAIFEVAGERPRMLTAGDALFLPLGTAHTLRDSPDTVPEAVCDGKKCPTASGARRIGGHGAVTTIVSGFFPFQGKTPVLLERMPRVLPLVTTDPSVGRWIAATVQLIVMESAAPGPASAIVLECLADVLFVQALRSLSTSGDCKRNGLAALADPPIHEALSLMHARVAEPWTVAELASRVGLSRSGFALRFSDLVGEPPLQYLARWRIARAAELLRHTDESVSRVANRVGYESVPSFTRAFKKWQGQSPGAFRRTPGEEASREG